MIPVRMFSDWEKTYFSRLILRLVDQLLKGSFRCDWKTHPLRDSSSNQYLSSLDRPAKLHLIRHLNFFLFLWFHVHSSVAKLILKHHRVHHLIHWYLLSVHFQLLLHIVLHLLHYFLLHFLHLSLPLPLPHFHLR